MQLPRSLIAATLLLIGYVQEVRCHGYLAEPPARNNIGYFAKDNQCKLANPVPINYNRMGLNCGGIQTQIKDTKNVTGESEVDPEDQKCGACGDRYISDRPHEYGKYHTANVAQGFLEGCYMNVKVQITAQHKGWFEFRLCHDVREPEPYKRPSNMNHCFDDPERHELLQFVNGGATRTDEPIEKTGEYTFQLQLPGGITCDHCVFQWKWHAGNNGNGQGPQEEFWNCADIAIFSHSIDYTDQRNTPNLMRCPGFPPVVTDCPAKINQGNQNAGNLDNNGYGNSGYDDTAKPSDNYNPGSSDVSGNGNGWTGGDNPASTKLSSLVCAMMQDHDSMYKEYRDCCTCKCEGSNAEECANHWCMNPGGCPTECSCTHVYTCN